MVIIAMEAHFIYSLSGQTVNSSSKFLSVTVTLHFTDYSWSYFQNCQRCFCKAAGGQNNNVTVSVNRWMGCNVAVGYERLWISKTQSLFNSIDVSIANSSPYFHKMSCVWFHMASLKFFHDVDRSRSHLPPTVDLSSLFLENLTHQI